MTDDTLNIPAADAPAVTPPAPAATGAKQPKVATIADDVNQRDIYPDIETALTRFDVIQAMPDAEGVTRIITGLVSETDADTGEVTHSLDATKYGEGYEVMVGKLTHTLKSEKVGEPGKMVIDAIFVHPIPTLELAFGLALPKEGTNAASDAVREVWRKEMNMRAVRPLRKALTGSAEAPSLLILAAEMPTTLSEYIEGQSSNGGLLKSFDELQGAMIKFMEKQSPLFKRANLKKAEFRKALESAAYAQFHYAPLEERGRFNDCLTLFIGQAEAQGKNAEIFTKWQNTRAEQSYDPTAEENEEEAFNVESMLAVVTKPSATTPTVSV